MQKDRWDNQIIPLMEQYVKMDQWLQERLESILPELMMQHKIDMWVIVNREYNEDPIYLTLVPALEKTASRLSCLAFHIDAERKFHALSFSRPNPSIEKYYKRAWDGTIETQWEGLRRFIHTEKPEKIGVNTSDTFALADGLTETLYNQLVTTLGGDFEKHLVSAENLAIGWLEKRSEKELAAYKSIYEIAENIINEAFSKEVVNPGTTTTEDIEWWMMQKINDLGLVAWFTPTVDLQRIDESNKRISGAVILQGDMLHCDIGIKYMGLCTDTQRIAYVLKDGESTAPEGLCNALGTCNLFQDIVAENFLEGRTGNEILHASLEEAKRQKLTAMCYTHPIGVHGHGAGPTIGLWDNQIAVPIMGDYPLHEDTCYALELNATSIAAEWNDQEITIFLEETVSYSGGKLEYIGERQKKFILI